MLPQKGTCTHGGSKLSGGHRICYKDQQPYMKRAFPSLACKQIINVPAEASNTI